MKKPYHIINRENAAAAEKLQEFARANGQYLLPLVDLINEARIAIDEVIEEAGRGLIETILQLSAQQIDQENRLLCERLGMSRGSEKCVICTEVLSETRRRQAERLASEIDGF